MSDYTELVKKLRNRRVCIQSGGSLGEDFPLMREAADAIEKLSTEVECLKSYMGEYKAAYIAEHDARMTEYKTDKDRQAEEARAEIIRRFRLFEEEHP